MPLAVCLRQTRSQRAWGEQRMAKNPRFRRSLWGSLAAVITLAHCVDGGLNENEREAGDGDEGVNVAFGEIAIDPTGSYLLANRDEELLYAQLASGQMEALPGLSEVARVAFGH